MFISSLTTKYSNIANIYGGGGKLFGGTYLFLLYIGMIIAAYYELLPKKNNFVLSIIFFGLIIFWWRFECINFFAIDSKLPFGGGFNPPSISSSTMAILMLFWLYNLAIVLESFSKVTMWFGNIWGNFGKHTLYIFLYHRLFLDYVLSKIYILQSNIWIKRFSYFVVMILGSILLEKIFYYIKAWYINCKNYVIENSKNE